VVQLESSATFSTPSQSTHSLGSSAYSNRLSHLKYVNMETNKLDRLPPGGFVSADIDHTIRAKQRGITNYQYRSSECSGPGLWRGLALDTDYLARITTLQLILNTPEDCKHAIIWLDSTPNLASLDLSLFDEIVFEFDEHFAHMKPALGPRMLKALRLENVGFSNGSCDNFCFLLRDLKRQPLSLKTFIIIENDTDVHDFDANCNDFLRSLDSPSRISLCICPESYSPNGMLDWSAL
jgi:hypothetical protein